jgi:hypothetical protein
MINVLTDLARRTRQHHAIEHATLHLLAQRLPHARLVGLSDPYGFTIFGDVEPSIVQRAASDALLRLQAGESHLAIHPNCGTNVATTALLVSAAALLAGAGKRGLTDRFMRTALFVVPALVASQPLGFRAQEVTTLADVGDRWLAGMRATRAGGLRLCRIDFK